MQLRGLDDMILATTIITQCRNSFPRSNGYAPNQWVLGQQEIRLPGSLLSDEESQRLEILEAAEDPRSALARTLSIREAARVAQIRLDTDSRVRRALLHQSTPTRGPFPVGSYVYFLRLQMPKGSSQRNYKWFGPARVIGCELRSPARLQDDEEVPTEGGQPRSYWLRYGSSVVLVTGEQLRFASEDELIAAHSIPQEVLEPEYARGARNFVDFRGPLAAPSQSEEPLALPAPSSGPLGDAPYLPEGFANPPAPLPPGVAPEPDSPGYSPSEQAPDQDGDQPLQPEAPTNDEVPAEQPDQPMGPFDQQHPAHNRQVSTISGAPEPEPQPVNTPAGQDRLGLGFMPPGPALDFQPGNLHTALQNPDRLDGYRAIPRQHGQRPSQPYFVEEDDFDCETLPTTLKGKRLERMLNYEGDALTSSQSEDEKEQCFVEGQGPGDVFLTGKAVRSEISLKDLSQEDRAKYDVSMAKEWSSWQKFNAVEVLTPQQIENLPEDTKIIGTRWVHTDKNQKKRLMSAALQGRTGKTQAQIQKEFPLEAKSRLVVQGHQETDTGIRSDSPTASLLAFNLVCAVAVIQRWIVMACDASTAYLQSNGISRLLLLRPPRPPPPGISPHDLLRALGSIYGTKDAGRAWWKKLFKTLRYYNWIMSRIEHALFFLVVDGKLCGILITHVDDLFCAGEGQQFHDSIEALEKDIHLKINKGKFRFCGKNVFQREDFSIEVDQYDAIEAIDYMVLSGDRRKMVNSPLTESEISSFRGLIGQMGWVTRQSRPDLMVNVNLMVNVSVAAQSMGCPRVKDVISLNKAVKAFKESYEAKWNFIYNDKLTLKDCIVFVFADSSFANGEGLKSQCGFITGLSIPELKGGAACPIMILETYSGSIKRVCRSTLAAESNGFLTGVEAGDYLRTLLMEITHPGEKLLDLDLQFVKSKLLCFTDAKSLEQTLNRDAGQPADKRVRILVSQIKEMIGENTYEDDSEAFAIWTDTSQMLADVLTKLGCERESLIHALERGQWQLEPSAEAKQKKLEIRAGRHARKAAKRAAVNELFDTSPTKVKNYGIWLRYDSRTNTHNMYKEFRNININGAVGQLYQEMAGRHRADPGSIQIIHAATVKDENCRREHVLDDILDARQGAEVPHRPEGPTYHQEAPDHLQGQAAKHLRAISGMQRTRKHNTATALQATQGSSRKRLEQMLLMPLKRIPNPYLGANCVYKHKEGIVSRKSSGFCIDFPRHDPSTYLVGTEEQLADGLVHRCSTSYNEQFLDTYYGHSGPVYRVRCNPFMSHAFLTCSADWTMKLWTTKPPHGHPPETPLLTFQSTDLYDAVNDVVWAPQNSTSFAAAMDDGRIELWDLAEKPLDPIVVHYPQAEKPQRRRTCVRFSPNSPVLVAGDDQGSVDVMRMYNTNQSYYSDQEQQDRLAAVMVKKR
eukprot:s2039_g3.t1